MSKIEVVTEKPPIYDRACEVFDLRGTVPVFTYAGKIWNPLGGKINDVLVAHERVHVAQQGDDSDGWWDRYFTDVEFRLAQEIEAYRAQYRYVRENRSKSQHSRFLDAFAMDLCGPMYGSSISYDDAMRAILGI